MAADQNSIERKLMSCSRGNQKSYMPIFANNNHATKIYRQDAHASSPRPSFCILLQKSFACCPKNERLIFLHPIQRNLQNWFQPPFLPENKPPTAVIMSVKSEKILIDNVFISYALACVHIKANSRTKNWSKPKQEKKNLNSFQNERQTLCARIRRLR